jgi:hypothetical protein
MNTALPLGMRVQPQCARSDGRINPGLPPPCGFIAAVMDLTMVSSTQWDSELIADFASERTTLCEAEVVGVNGASAANQARVLRDKHDMIPVTNPAPFRQ